MNRKKISAIQIVLAAIFILAGAGCGKNSRAAVVYQTNVVTVLQTNAVGWQPEPAVHLSGPINYTYTRDYNLIGTVANSSPSKTFSRVRLVFNLFEQDRQLGFTTVHLFNLKPGESRPFSSDALTPFQKTKGAPLIEVEE